MGPRPWRVCLQKESPGPSGARPGLRSGHGGQTHCSPAPSVPQWALSPKTLTLLPGFPVGPGGPCTPRGPCPESGGKGSVCVHASQRQKHSLVPMLSTRPAAHPPSCQLAGQGTGPTALSEGWGQRAASPLPPQTPVSSATLPASCQVTSPTTFLEETRHVGHPHPHSHGLDAPEMPLRRAEEGCSRTCGPMSPGSPFRPPLPGGP